MNRLAAAALATIVLATPGAAGRLRAAGTPATVTDRTPDATPADRAADDFNMAAWLYASRKYDLAAEEFRGFLRKYPEHEKAAEARLGLARALLHAGKNDEAADALQELRRKHPRFDRLPEALFHLGQALAAGGKPRDALDAYDELIKKHADHYLAPWARARQGEVLVGQKDFAAAEKVLGPLVEQFLTADGAGGRLKAERARLDKAGPGLADGLEALLERAHLNLGLARFGAQRYDAARQALEEFLALAPKSPLAPTARFYLAQSLYKAGQFERAAEAYADLAQGKGDLAPDAAFERALALYQAKKFKDAAAAFADCAKRFPQSPRADKARLYAGMCLYQADDLRGTIQGLKGLTQDAEAQYWLGLAQRKEGKAAEALAALDRSLALAPDGPRAGDALLAKADLLSAAGKTDEAAALYRRFADAHGDRADSGPALYAAATALHKAGQYGPSEALCEKVLAKGGAGDLAAQALFLWAENRFLQKDAAGAAERYQALLQKHAQAPEAAAARLRLAWIECAAARYDAALAHLDRLDPARTDAAVVAEAAYVRGQCLLEKQQPQKAAEALAAYLAAPGAARYREDAMLKHGLALARSGRAGEAVARLQEFLRAYGSGALAPEAEVHLGDLLLGPEAKPDEAAAHFRRVADRAPDHRLAPYALYGLGLARLARDQADAAGDAFARLIEKYPQSDLLPQALYQRGLARQKTGETADARGAFEALLGRFPQHDLAPAARLGLGLCLQKEKRFEEAAEALRPLADAAKDPKVREQAAYELAWSLQQAGREKEAAEAFRALVQKSPGGAAAADAFFHLAEAAYRDKKFDQAAGLYERALAADKDGRVRDKALYRLGWCRWSADKFAEAAALFDRLVAEAPDGDLAAEALLQAGEAYLRLGRPADAIPRLEKLLDPRHKDFASGADARLRLGEAQLVLGRTEDALATFSALEQAYPKYPLMAEVQFHLGRALYELKRYDQARARFERAVSASETETAAKAQFYIGETFLAGGEPREALKAYLRVVALWGACREWAAAAQFETGKCHEALGQPADAREAYRTVVEKYADTKWAAPAREQLKKAP